MVQDVGHDILPKPFKRLHIVLHDKYDDEYLDPELTYDGESRFTDFHEENGEE